MRDGYTFKEEAKGEREREKNASGFLFNIIFLLFAFDF